MRSEILGIITLAPVTYAQIQMIIMYRYAAAKMNGARRNVICLKKCLSINETVLLQLSPVKSGNGTSINRFAVADVG